MTMMLMKRSREDNGDVEAEAMTNCLMFLANVGRMTSSSSSSDSFQCKTCDKKFSSFQALGGHRASHKRQKLVAPAAGAGEQDSLLCKNKSKIHQCSICGLEFSMGQALGGHMRKHRAAMTKDSSEKSLPMPPPPALAVPVLKRCRSSKRVFGFDLDLDLHLAPQAEVYSSWKCIRSTATPLTPATPVLRCFI